MMVDRQQARLWIKEYEVEDLARSLLREYLIQNNLRKTLESMQVEEERRYKKIGKGLLIKMLSMSNLVGLNREREKPYPSLLEVLVGYLKEKFINRVEEGVDMGVRRVDGGETFGEVKNRNENMGNRKYSRECVNEKQQKNNGKIQSCKLKQKQKYRQANKKVSQIYAALEKEMELQKEKYAEEQQRFKSEKREEEIRRRRQAELKRKMDREEEEKQRQKLKEMEIRRLEELRKKQQEEREKRQRKVEEELKTREELRMVKQEERKEQERRQRQEMKAREYLRKVKEEEREQEKRQKLVLEERRRKQVEVEKEKEKEKEKMLKQQKQQKQKQQLRRRQEEENRQLQQKESVPEIEKQSIVKEMLIQRQQPQQEQSNGQKPSEKQLIITKDEHKQDSEERSPKLQKNTRVGAMRQLKKPTINKLSVDKLNINQLQTKQINTKADQSKPPSQPNTQLIQFPLPKIIHQQQSHKMEGEVKMMKIFGKKKNNSESYQVDDLQMKKFKFDENFVDEPLRKEGERYRYERFKLDGMVIEGSYPAEITYRQKYMGKSKKYQERALSEKEIQQLKKALFQQGGLSSLPKSWNQGFILSPYASTPYGLQQIEGGPCGIIAAVQCYFLKHLLCVGKPGSEGEVGEEVMREKCLVAGIVDLLMKVRGGEKIYLMIPGRGFSGAKMDIGGLRMVSIEGRSFLQVFQGVWQHRSYFIGRSNHGVAVLLYSILMSKGENPLIGNHGHCTQQLVNMFICGYACSNCFDGSRVLDSQLRLQGVQERGEFGFLSIFETLGYMEIGKYLKNPVFPFWIVCKQYHYNVIFANNYLISVCDDVSKFDIVYFDGLYNCADRIVITLEMYGYDEEVVGEVKDLPLIEQVMMAKWGRRKADWNGSVKIL